MDDYSDELEFVKTVWLADLDEDGKTTPLVLATGIPNVYLETPEYIKVVARVYLDGAKQDDSDNYYVKIVPSYDIEELNFNFVFTTD